MVDQHALFPPIAVERLEERLKGAAAHGADGKGLQRRTVAPGGAVWRRPVTHQQVRIDLGGPNVISNVNFQIPN